MSKFKIGDTVVVMKETHVPGYDLGTTFIISKRCIEYNSQFSSERYFKEEDYDWVVSGEEVVLKEIWDSPLYQAMREE